MLIPKMPSLRNLFSSSSSQSPSPSSSSTSPCESPLKQGSDDTNFFKNGGGGSESKRELTRLRKLRYPADESACSPLVSPGTRSPTHLGRWWTPAVPQPLPLPEFIKRTDQSNSREATSRAEADGADGAAAASKPSSSSATGSNFSHQSIRNAPYHVTSKSSRAPTCRHRRFPQGLNVESASQKFRIDVSPRSAPTSGFSSPAFSPKRFSTVDLFPSSSMIPQEFQALSILEGPVPNKFAGHSSQMFPETHSCNSDHSPLHSPKLRRSCQKTTDLTGLACHSHHKSLPENSTGWPGGCAHANLHRLPLPPGGLKPSQSAITHCIAEKQDASLMRGQWLKGKLIGCGTYGRVYEAFNRETGALCAMKEVDLIVEDPKSAECIKQLEQPFLTWYQSLRTLIIGFCDS
ncbi:mitogen-activated protein kinase kinase kinase 5-like isoform X2 [Diospyros lotus]|uniref:mitogen-activated protein kinase kinase kinase 5-like isoform X2 n=1 Tax=Diospyros lotus TaxID=55363 RepID=UPI0022505C63|nr:mitogen-activated protein kinase kinase kinase 5-like isoform X2 [Diospyros lotus]